MRSPEPITIRLAGPGDVQALRRLAALDSRPVPPAPQLVAEREGRIDAALSLSNGASVADPFRHTAHLCELLCHRADGLRAAPRRRLRLRPEPAEPILGAG
jgi:hypothetical protein